jgi:hypothetical protein
MECANLTSETNFSRHNASTWHALTPMMELYVRRINIELIDRTFAPIISATLPSRRGFINEVAFQIFANSHLPKDNSEAFCVLEAKKTIERLDRVNAQSIPDPDVSEMADVREQIRRLRFFFESARFGRPLEVKPKFSGCGIIGSCEGDVYFENQLFEIKAGDRNVRSVDIRQVLVYCALNYASRQRMITSVGLFNPRVGTHFSTSLEELCNEVSGRSATEMLAELVRIFSSGDISR